MNTTTFPTSSDLTSTEAPLTDTPRAHQAADTVRNLADRGATRAESAIESTRRATNSALDSVQAGVGALRDSLPTSFEKGASRVEAMARSSIDRAKATSANLQAQCAKGADTTRGYIQNDPLKSVLIAAAAGAAVAGLIGWLNSRRVR